MVSSYSRVKFLSVIGFFFHSFLRIGVIPIETAALDGAKEIILEVGQKNSQKHRNSSLFMEQLPGLI